MNELPTITSHAYGMAVGLKDVLARPQDAGQLRAQYVSPRNDDPPLLKVNPTMPTRIVRVLVVDPDTRVPLEQRVLHKGDEQLTDLTDQELFYELPIKDLLDQHNIRRSIIIDKAVKDRMAYLDPIRVRDLRMLVVTVADF